MFPLNIIKHHSTKRAFPELCNRHDQRFQAFQDLTKHHMLPVEPIGGRHGDEEPAMAG